MRLIDTSVQQRRFLTAFAACGQVVKAARWCKLHRQAHYNWMKDDPSYPARFRDAEAKAARTLEDEIIRRGHEGIRKAVWYKGKIVGYETEYSDACLIAALKANAPEKYRDRYEHTGSIEHTGQVDIRAAIMQVIQRLPEDQRAVIARGLLELEKAG